MLDDATWGLFQEGWRDPWGADADHLKTPEDVDAFVAAGYTLYTVDPGEDVDNSVIMARPATIVGEVQALPWDVLEDTPRDMEFRHLECSLDLGDSALTFDRLRLYRTAKLSSTDTGGNKMTLSLSNLCCLPMPRQLAAADGVFALPETGLIALDAADPQAGYHAALTLRETLRRYASVCWELVAGTAAPPEQVRAGLSVTPGGVRHPQGYELTITPERIHLVAETPAGLFYGVQTLGQIIRQTGRTLPALRCSDWPDFPARGVMLDISRDKVPTMETLYALVDMLAAWKINQLQLYTEHTFAYRRHPVVWADASPVTGEEILALDAYCRERFIELVPNQNSFGHMRRWLVHEQYRHLAECPHGSDTIWGHFDEPFTLCPDAESLNLIRTMYDELLPHFSSRQFNVGCDETVDLGRGRSSEAAAQRGVARLYFDFLMEIYREVKARGRTMQFWGDIIMAHPELAAELPRDLIALEWGYEADHPFDRHGAIFAASGVPFYVCPGTSSWNTVAGRTDNALGNLRSAAENGLRHGAVGYLNTDWGDNGHWQPLPVSYLGFAYGAAVSWACAANRDLDIARALDLYAFHDRAGVMGRLAYDLGNVYQMPDFPVSNASILFTILQNAPRDLPSGRLVETLPATVARIDEIMAALDQARMECPDADLVKREFTWAANALRHACRRGLWALGQPEDRRALAADADLLRATYEEIWHARNRPGGFRESAARLERMRRDYEVGSGE